MHDLVDVTRLGLSPHTRTLQMLRLSHKNMFVANVDEVAILRDSFMPTHARFMSHTIA